ncbi:unnamed protein product [Strongylus vulgaris]|uniref:Uncharacterized protein n=1 Tax=Strongylus vulgaris TaxID=40348 RepID=A0A3P7IQ58_STRVU|nr:unnamed protein product [Strongylus vulgaris]
MRNILDTVDFSISVSLCVSQLLFSVLRSVSSAADPTIVGSNSFGEFSGGAKSEDVIAI